MERVKFGRTESLVSPMGVGTYYDFTWIAPAKILRIRKGAEQKVDAIKSAFDSGINFIDTAEIYETEPLVGRAVKDMERDKLFIATKVWPIHFSYDGVIKSCNRSLKKLNMKYIDLYQLHFGSNTKKIKEALRAMEFLADQGKIRHIGISNFNIDQTKEAVSSLKKYDLASTQMNFNVSHRNIEKDIIPYCKENGIAVLAYYPLAHGILTEELPETKDVLKTIEESHGKKTVPQIALNWFMSKYDFVFPIPRASNPDHVRENAGSMGWKMSQDEIDMLENSVRSINGPTWSGDKT